MKKEGSYHKTVFHSNRAIVTVFRVTGNRICMEKLALFSTKNAVRKYNIGKTVRRPIDKIY